MECQWAVCSTRGRLALTGDIIELLSDPVKAVSIGARARRMVEKKFYFSRFRPAILTAYASYNAAINVTWCPRKLKIKTWLLDKRIREKHPFYDRRWIKDL